jgi:hypothetical protein
MRDEPAPSPEILANARLVVKVLTAYRYFDEGLTSERELNRAVSKVLAEADVPLLVTSLAHSTIEFVKRTAWARGESVEQIMEVIEDELRPFEDSEARRA